VTVTWRKNNEGAPNVPKWANKGKQNSPTQRSENDPEGVALTATMREKVRKGKRGDRRINRLQEIDEGYKNTGRWRELERTAGRHARWRNEEEVGGRNESSEKVSRRKQK